MRTIRMRQEANSGYPHYRLKIKRSLTVFGKKPFAQRMGFAGKTPWDFIQLLLIPLVLAGVGFWFSAQQNQTSLQVSERQHQADLQIAATRYANDQQLVADQQQETTLKTYLDDMSNLLLNNKLLESKPGDPVRQVARERTLTALRRLQAERNGIVLQFLQDAHLIGEKNAVIDLNDANLSNDDLKRVNLSGADLRRANLSNADLRYADLNSADLTLADLNSADLTLADLRDADLNSADLRGANLSSADLRGANLTDANLTDANLTGVILSCTIQGYQGVVQKSCTNLHHANLHHANLYNADLSGADLSSADLSSANLYNADLSGADLSSADLSGANLRGADLRGAFLSYANLRGAIVTQEQLAKAESLRGATMPDGSKHP